MKGGTEGPTAKTKSVTPGAEAWTVSTEWLEKCNILVTYLQLIKRLIKSFYYIFANPEYSRENLLTTDPECNTIDDNFTLSGH